MSGGDHPSRAGRITALATLAVSASMFVTALFGISSIDPSAGAAAPAARPLPPAESISLEPSATDRHGDDCPFRDQGRGSGEQRRTQSTS